ncbi:MAG: hypothetical protein KC776_22945 [Myxococcales bacterium]|nr:hypothetical protein [Myxococcales bacterium]
MSFFANADVTVSGSMERAFAELSDFRSWKAFMPPEFTPVRGPSRILKSGDRVHVKLDTGMLMLPAVIQILWVRAPKEIAWSGGNALLRAEHRFYFETTESGETRIRSEEEWTGALSHVGALARRIKRQAEIIGSAQLHGLATHLKALSS